MSLAISLRSETLKLKRTIILYLCVAAAAFTALMSFLEYLDLGPSPKKGLPWIDHFMKGREPLCLALLPLYVILICTLLLQIEYRDKTWKQVLSSPQKMFDIFFAKFITLQFMILAFLIVYNLFLVLTGFGAELMHPDLYDGGIDFSKILIKTAQTYILIMGVSAIQFWLSLRFRNFIAPLAIGIALWFIAPLMVFVFKVSFVEQYPYAFTMLSELSKYEANVATYEWYSIITAVLFLSLAFVEFRVRKVKT
jgi:hypothetical protein